MREAIWFQHFSWPPDSACEIFSNVRWTREKKYNSPNNLLVLALSKRSRNQVLLYVCIHRIGIQSVCVFLVVPTHAVLWILVSLILLYFLLSASYDSFHIKALKNWLSKPKELQTHYLNIIFAKMFGTTLAMLSDPRIPVNLFGKRYKVCLKRIKKLKRIRENMSGYTEVIYTDGSKTEEDLVEPVVSPIK